MIFQDKQVHLRRHETSVSICRSTDYAGTSDIEAGVDDCSTASLFLKFLDQAIISTIAIFRNGLNSSRVVDVSNRWDVGSFDPYPLERSGLCMASLSSSVGWVRMDSLTGATSSM